MTKDRLMTVGIVVALFITAVIVLFDPQESLEGWIINAFLVWVVPGVWIMTLKDKRVWIGYIVPIAIFCFLLYLMKS